MTNSILRIRNTARFEYTTQRKLLHRHHHFFRFVCVCFIFFFIYYFFFLAPFYVCVVATTVWRFYFASHLFVRLEMNPITFVISLFRFEFEWQQKWCDLHTHTCLFEMRSLHHTIQSVIIMNEDKKMKKYKKKKRKKNSTESDAMLEFSLSIVTAGAFDSSSADGTISTCITYRRFQFKFICMLVVFHSLRRGHACVLIGSARQMSVSVCVRNDSVFFPNHIEIMN